MKTNSGDTRIRWDEAGFTGKNLDGSPACCHIGSAYSLDRLIVPSLVTAEKRKERWLEGGPDDCEYLVYATPRTDRLWRDREVKLFHGMSPGSLSLCGWVDAELRESREGLLKELLRLADAHPSEIARFVQRWGPLWLCHNPEHRMHGCRYVPGQGIFFTPCYWLPYEPVDEFRKISHKMRLMLDTACRLLKGITIPACDWIEMGVPEWIVSMPGERLNEHASAWEHQLQLSGMVNWELEKPGSVGIGLDWGHPPVDNEEAQGVTVKPQMVITQGFGFLPAAWLQLAMLIANSHNLYVCDGCGSPYIRELKKPKPGQRNYCASCRRGSIRKRDWAREKAGSVG